MLKTPLRFIQQLPIKKTRTIYPLQSGKPHLNIPRNTAQAFLPSPLISNDFETRNFSHCRRVEPRIIRLQILGGRLHAGIIIHWREIKATLIFERVKLFLLAFPFFFKFIHQRFDINITTIQYNCLFSLHYIEKIRKVEVNEWSNGCRNRSLIEDK